MIFTWSCRNREKFAVIKLNIFSKSISYWPFLKKFQNSSTFSVCISTPLLLRTSVKFSSEIWPLSDSIFPKSRYKLRKLDKEPFRSLKMMNSSIFLMYWVSSNLSNLLLVKLLVMVLYFSVTTDFTDTSKLYTKLVKSL